jgi:hypothetical protein
MNNAYGLLINKQDILLHRSYFNELVMMLGVQVKHRAPRPDKHYTTYAEVQSNYFEPEVVGCIFNDHPDRKTMKKLGWNAELNTEAIIISVPYDLNGIQKDSLFYLPSAFDNTSDRLFRVTELSSIMIYPASITCRVVPEYTNTFSANLHDHSNNSFNLLRTEDED